jgi:sarcosine oxidase, subunit gamma
MAADPKLVRRDALGSLAGELVAVRSAATGIESAPLRSVLNLRGPATDEFVGTIGAEIGVTPPLTPNTWTGDDSRSAIWLGPDEWLLVAPEREAEVVEGTVREACRAVPRLSIVDVSHNYATFLVSGYSSRELLSKGCALDLAPSAFGAGASAQTLLAKTRVLLRALEERTGIELWVRNSFARYTAQWLLDASREFQRKSASF